MNAPTNSPARYSGTSPQSVVPSTANPIVIAGFRCAPLNCATANTAVITARPHPKVMTIQPPFWALERLSSTPATTPLPSRISNAVPITSAPKMLIPNVTKSFPPPPSSWYDPPARGHYLRPSGIVKRRSAMPNWLGYRLWSVRADPVDRTRRGDPPAPLRSQSAARRRTARGRARPAEGDGARDPADVGD